MSALDLTAAMDGIAACVVAWGGVPNAYPWPVESITVPCGVVGYPSGEIDIAITFGRGGDRATLPLWIVVGKTATKDARDALSDVIAGGSDLVAAIVGAHTWGDADVTGASVATFTSSSIEYLALKLDVDVVT